jgi:hypothetical protein
MLLACDKLFYSKRFNLFKNTNFLTLTLLDLRLSLTKSSIRLVLINIKVIKFKTSSIQTISTRAGHNYDDSDSCLRGPSSL